MYVELVWAQLSLPVASPSTTKASDSGSVQNLPSTIISLVNGNPKNAPGFLNPESSYLAWNFPRRSKTSAWWPVLPFQLPLQQLSPLCIFQSGLCFTLGKVHSSSDGCLTPRVRRAAACAGRGFRVRQWVSIDRTLPCAKPGPTTSVSWGWGIACLSCDFISLSVKLREQ